MATQEEIEFVYDDLDEMWRARLGEHADITAAFFNGDFRKTLEQAQRDKHNWIFENVGFEPGHRIIDIGCGWGPILKAVKERDGQAIGLTLSPKQVKACKRAGLDARLCDWKDLVLDKIGKFDAVISIGAFEHFCSVEEFLAGEQDKVYGDFFNLCSDLLAENGRLFLQTMTWGTCLPWGERKPTLKDIKECSFKAPKKSDERVLAAVMAFFPGSWIPRDIDHLIPLAQPHFDLITSNDGRLDYIQTLTEWGKKWSFPKIGLQDSIRIMYKYLTAGKAYRGKLECIRNNCIREVFIRNLFGHQRMFFQKR